MQYTINQLRSEVFQQVYPVYEVFQNYFGEASVDLQNIPSDDFIADMLDEREIPMREDGSCYEGNGNKFNSVKSALAAIRPFILVYWPKVKVTNENDKSILIRDLYAKVELDSKGRIPTENRGFLLNRATYPIEQWVSGYMHSHISSIPKSHLQEFQQPCLGSGPIIETINSLKADLAEDFDEIRWMLFCEELSRYVTVESLKGVPYNHLEEVGMGSQLSEYRDFNESMGINCMKYVFPDNYMDVLRDFILYYLKQGHLSFNFQKGTFQIGMSHFDYIIDVSNSFIDYFNSHYDSKNVARLCFCHSLLKEVSVSGGKFYTVDNTRSLPDTTAWEGQKVCDFRGQEIKLHIIAGEEFTPQKTTVLSHGLAMFILNNILKIVNYHYTNEYTRQHWQGINPSHSATALPAPTHQRVYYL